MFKILSKFSNYFGCQQTSQIDFGDEFWRFVVFDIGCGAVVLVVCFDEMILFGLVVVVVGGAAYAALVRVVEGVMRGVVVQAAAVLVGEQGVFGEAH